MILVTLRGPLQHLKRRSNRTRLFLSFVYLNSHLGFAQARTSTTARASVSDSSSTVHLTGSVTDPSGAFIPNATLSFSPLGASADADPNGPSAKVFATDSAGHFVAVLPTGNYLLSVTAEGFTALSRTVVLGPRPSALDLHLAIAASDQVNVSADNDASTANADNKSAMVFKSEQLDQLSSSDSLLQQEVLAMAGGSGEGGGQIYVDGFSGGTFPPKDTIREIRINQNPFSSQYEGLGNGRVEIFTKPGGDKMHGDFRSSGSTKALNSLNPYTGEEPSYFLLFNRANLSGPLGKKTSFYLSGLRSDQHNIAVVSAFNPDGSPLTSAVTAPTTVNTFSGRVDRQLGKNNTFIGRYQYSSTDVKNNGVGLLVLPSEGTTNNTTVQTVQLSNTQLIGANIVSETRFQYLRTRLDQTPNSTAPTIVVQGAFNSGGSPTQASSDSQDAFEFQEYLSISHGNHFIRTGVRYRLLHETNTSTANYNGQYTFANLAAYQAGTPTLFSLTAGKPDATLLTGDVGLYAEDEWKARKDLTVSLGARLESQSAIPDHLNIAPRGSISWAVGKTDKHAPLVVLRAGSGIFYQRFAAGNMLTSIRQNGISQQSYLIANPTFYPLLPSTSQLTGTPSTPYGISPNLKIAATNIFSFAVERSLGKFGQVTATYYAVRGVHQYNSANINAPLANGTRPLGGNADVYQFQSAGIQKAQSLVLNANLNFGKHVSVFAFYTARRQGDDAHGAASFASQPYNLSADYGASGLGMQAVGQRAFVGSNFKLPLGFEIGTFAAAFSRSRFNITTGTDRNGDTQFNDRPAFATNPGPTSQIYTTAFGRFDANPQLGEAIIPYNYGLAPRLFFLAAEVDREFKFGKRPAAEAAASAPAKPGPPPAPETRYSWRFSFDAENALNTNNAGPPVGVLSSPLFGRSNSINSLFGSLTAANRVIFLETAFRF
jgi:hypothetical protein